MRRLLPLLVAVAALLSTAAPAHAHGEEGRLEVVDATPSDEGSSVTYRVELTYLNDGDPVDGAEVTVTSRQQGQTPSAPQTMEPEGGGIYAATVAFPTPGNWTVQFDTAEPVATVQATFRVEPPPPTTVAPTTVPPPPTTAVESENASLADPGESDEPPAFLVVGLIVAGVLVVAAAVALLIRRRREASSA